MSSAETTTALGNGDSTASFFPLPTISEQDEAYSVSQTAFLSIAPKISSMLSVVGCVWIVLEVWHFSNKKYYVYHKTISAMAFYCIIVSLWYFVSDWATENKTSCRVQGYFVQMSLAPMLYFAMLFLYYVLVIAYSLPEQKLTSNSTSNLSFKSFRPNWQQIFHTIPFILSVVTASVSLSLNLFHPSRLSSWCWIAEPFQNEGSEISSRDIIAFQWGIYLGPSWFAFFVILVCLTMVFHGVENQEIRMKKYVTATTILKNTNIGLSSGNADTKTPEMDSLNSRNDSTSMCSSAMTNLVLEAHSAQGIDAKYATESFIGNTATLKASSGESSNKTVSRKNCIFSSTEYWEHRPRTWQVLVQCLCYVFAFFWSIIFWTINEIILWSRMSQSIQNPVPYALMALQGIYQPLLGFFIFLAYRRPFYMRMRRQGLSRVQALLRSFKWNQNPVDPPGSRYSPSRREGKSAMSSAAELEQRRIRRREQKEQMRQRMEENHQPRHLHGTARRNSSIQRIDTSLRNFFQRSNARSTEETQETSDDILRGSSPAHYVAKEDNVAVNTELDEGPSSINFFHTRTNQGSNSTVETRRTSFITKGDSSPKLESPKNDSFRRDISLEDGEDNSMCLEDLLDEASNGEESPAVNEEEDVEAQRQSLGIGSRVFESKESKEDFDLIKQSSDTYQDLVFMDIFPEADGAMEEKWRLIEARISRYEKTKHDRYKLNMSVPVISERHFGSHPDIVDSLEKSEFVQPKSNETETNNRFTWSKNPLFKVSGRRQGESTTPKQPDEIKVAPKKTSSGGFFSSSSNEGPDDKFIAKLAKERSRQEMLQVISSRRIQSIQSAEDDELCRMVQPSAAAELATATNISTKSLDNAKMSSNPLLDAGVDQDGRSHDDRDLDFAVVYTTAPLACDSPSRSGDRKPGRRFRGRSASRSRESLDDIPETSEHSERGAMRRMADHRDKPPKAQRRLSSEELSVRGDGVESSTEFTERSVGSSIRTIKRSNRQSSGDSRNGHRNSHSSELASDGVSLVSDGPMSEDGFLSDASSDNEDDKPADNTL